MIHRVTDALPPPSGAPQPPPPYAVPPGPLAQPGQPDEGVQDQQYLGGPPSGRNGLAIAALCCGIAAFVPLVGVVAIVLGVVALHQLRSGHHRGRGLAVTGIVLGALGSLAWGAFFAIAVATGIGDEVDRAPSGQVTSAQSGTAVEALVAGDCFTGSRSEQIDTVTLIPCASAHESQVTVTFELPDGSYPGKDAVIAAAEEGCSDKADPLLTDKAFDELEPSFIYPSDGFAWKLDRRVLCIVDATEGTTTGSALK